MFHPFNLLYASALAAIFFVAITNEEIYIYQGVFILFWWFIIFLIRIDMDSNE